MGCRRCWILGTIFSSLFIRDSMEHELLKSKNYTYDMTSYVMELYRAHPVVTWDQAKDACKSFDRHLALLDDWRLVEDMAGFFRGTQDNTRQYHPWVAGHRHDSTEWRYLDDRQYSGAPLHEGCAACNGPSCCAEYHLDSELYKCPCKAILSNKHAMCQYSAVPTCRSGDVSMSDSCYHLNNSRGFSWYEAANYCSREFDGGILSVNNFTYVFNHTNFTGHIWMGLVKQPWMWHKPDGKQTVVTYYNWFEEQGDGLGENCLHLEGSKGGRWSDKPCTVPSYYFMCQTITRKGSTINSVSTIVSSGANTLPVSSETSGMTSHATLEFHDNTVTTIRMVPSVAPSLGVPVGVGVGVGVLVIIIILTVVLVIIRRRKRKRGISAGGKTEDRPAPEGHELAEDTPLPVITTTSNPHVNSHNATYEEITLPLKPCGHTYAIPSKSVERDRDNDGVTVMVDNDTYAAST